MRLTTWIAFALGAFYLVAGLLYAATADVYGGFPLLMAAAVAIAGFGGYMLLTIRRAERALAASEAEPEEVEPHVGPTIWPLGYALSAVGLVLGFLAYPPLYVIGAGLFVASTSGWFADVRRQWRHADDEPPSPGPPRGPDTTPLPNESIR
jgi:hypothetical protein